MGKESKRVDKCTCVTDSLCYTAEIEHCKTTKLIKILKINKFVCTSGFYFFSIMNIAAYNNKVI